MGVNGKKLLLFHSGVTWKRLNINPRLPEPFFVTRLPKGGGYLPRFSLLSLRFL